MMRRIARLHILALPHTLSSRMGEGWVAWLYGVVGRVGYIRTVKREGKIVGVMSGVGRVILTLVVDPAWQRKGIGRELLGKLQGVQYVYTEECSVGFYTKMGFHNVGKLGGTILLCRK